MIKDIYEKLTTKSKCSPPKIKSPLLINFILENIVRIFRQEKNKGV